MEDLSKITYFAETDHRGRVPFGIKADDRSKHVYVIGKTGMGKSTLLENMAVQDIKEGNGICFVDPHGKTAELLLEYIPEERHDDVIYFAPFDMEHPISFNIMEDVGYDKRHLVANGLMSAFKKIWADQWSSRMEYILNNVVLALLEYPDSTLLGINRMLTDNAYRKKVVDNITDPSTKSFWVDEFAKYTDRYTKEATPAIQNKVGQFTANPLIRNIIGQPKSSFNFRDAMDKKKIVIINLSKGRIGEGNALLLGSMLITKLYLSAMSRADLTDGQLQKEPNFYLFVDEFQSFANESFADILSEARKYKLNLTIAHQYIEQMPEEVRSAVFGNVGTMITFRVGAYDAEVLEKEFAPKFYSDDLVNLGFTQIYLKLMIDGVSSQPFSAVTLPPIKLPDVSHKDVVIRKSRELYTKPQKEVEEQIKNWYKQGAPESLGVTKKLPVKKDNNIDKHVGANKFQQKLEKRSNNEPVIKREEELRKRVEKEVTESLSENINRNNVKPKTQDRTRTFRKDEDKQETTGRLPLSALKGEAAKQGIPKDSGNRDSLKSALKGILENKSESKDEKKVPVVSEDEKKKKKSSDEIVSKAKETPKETQKEVPKEVPEDVLRKVLDVKGDKKE